MKFTFLFLNLAKIHIFIPNCTSLGNIPRKKTVFSKLPLGQRRSKTTQTQKINTLFKGQIQGNNLSLPGKPEETIFSLTKNNLVGGFIQ